MPRMSMPNWPWVLCESWLRVDMGKKVRWDSGNIGLQKSTHYPHDERHEYPGRRKPQSKREILITSTYRPMLINLIGTFLILQSYTLSK